MTKSADAFRTISEVAEWLDTPTHVLRFWESKFSQVKPVKRAGGRRYYRPSDMELLAGIKKLLHEDGVTIRGVQKILREQGVRHVVAVGYELSAVQEKAAERAAAPSAIVEQKVVPLRPATEEAKPPLSPEHAAPPSETDAVNNIFANIDDDDQAPMLFANLPKDSAKQEAQPLPTLPGASPSFLSALPTLSDQLQRIPAQELANDAARLGPAVQKLRSLRDKIAASVGSSRTAGRS